MDDARAADDGAAGSGAASRARHKVAEIDWPG